MISTNRYTYGSLFAGIGGFCEGFLSEGFEGLWANDILPESHDSYLLNHPTERFILESISHIKAKDLEPVDVLHGGFPCQSFSQAGNRSGFKDPRGMLFFDIIRLLHEWGSDKPSVVLLENSPYIQSGDNGNWFAKIKSELQLAGYWFSDSNLVELSTNIHGDLPQKRKRAFLCALNQEHFDWNPFSQYDFPENPLNKPLKNFLKKGESVNEKYYLDPENKYAKMLLDVKVDDPYRLYHLRKYEVRVQSPNSCPTLTANMGSGGHNVPFLYDSGRFRKLTERECLMLQGFDNKFAFPDHLSMGKRYHLIGNAVSPTISKVLAKRIKELLLNERT